MAKGKKKSPEDAASIQESIKSFHQWRGPVERTMKELPEEVKRLKERFPEVEAEANALLEGAQSCAKEFFDLEKEIGQTDLGALAPTEAMALMARIIITSTTLTNFFTELSEIFTEYLEKPVYSIFIGGQYADSRIPRKGQQLELDLFSSLSPATQAEINRAEVKPLDIGIRLSVAEDKLVFVLLGMVSDIRNAGSIETTAVDNYGPTRIDTPVLTVSPGEVIRRYTGKTKYTGKDTTNVRAVLGRLAGKNHLIRYERTDPKTGSKTIIETYSPVIRFEGQTDTKGKAKQWRIVLNPVFVDQIQDKYITAPNNLFHRLEELAGGPRKVTTAMVNLTLDLLRTKSSKQKTATRGLPALITIMGLEAEDKAGKRARVSERITTAVSVVEKLGLAKAQLTSSKQGQPQYKFTVNKKFH